MMENAGLQLARLMASMATKSQNILIGVGTGNNGGGGLVAARRLAGWGYRVFIHIPDESLKPLPAIQYKRAISFGANPNPVMEPAIFADAYFGFSQRLPLPTPFILAIEKAQQLKAIKISLDLPTGFDPDSGSSLFSPDTILTMAAPKKELLSFHPETDLLVADIGIPEQLYKQFGIDPPPFDGKGYISHNTPKI
jgi:hydroxyethylthiazole kinase-like uncharacterized protein yjeF